MAKRVTGSLRKVTINGITFDAAADTNFSFTPTNFENSVIATTGSGMVKKMKRVPVIESLPLVVDGEKLAQLVSLDGAQNEYKFSITLQSGTELKGKGVFQSESYENEEGRYNIQIHPTGDWTIIAQ